MTEERLTSTDLLDRWSAEPPSNTVPKAVVIDRLLDLRNVSGPATAQAIDDILVRTPGATIVPGGWWRAQLDFLRADVDIDLTFPLELPTDLPTEEDLPHEAAIPPNDAVAGGRPAGRWRRRRSRPADDDHRDQRI